MFGGMLGSTFNYVFERQMEALQGNDRMYYLLHNEGLPLLSPSWRAPRSPTSYAATPHAANVPVMAFTRPDYACSISPSAKTNPAGISRRSDHAVLRAQPRRHLEPARKADGAIRLTGKGTAENHSTWLGTNGDDKVVVDRGRRLAVATTATTARGRRGRRHGQAGGSRRRCLADAQGNDVIDGGEGNDVIHGGSANIDSCYGSDGDVAIIPAPTTRSRSPVGVDLVVGGESVPRRRRAAPGRDWVEGGFSGSMLTGNERADFGILAGEDDVLIGQGGGRPLPVFRGWHRHPDDRRRRQHVTRWPRIRLHQLPRAAPWTHSATCRCRRCSAAPR